jgi:hypothetical protein
MPSLAEFQREFAAALLAPDADPVPGAASIALRVHRNTVLKGLVDSIQANYPTVGVLMGAEWLAGMARTYALRHPPRHAVLATYGESFPGFLRASGADRDWPYLSAVAQLDLAWTQSLLAPDERALTARRLAGLDPDALASIQLRLHQSARYGVHAGSAVTVWKANRPPAAPPAELHIDGCEEAAVIVRNDQGVSLLSLDAAARAFLEAIISGSSIAEAAGHALQEAPDGDVAAAWSTLLAQGVFADFTIQGE